MSSKQDSREILIAPSILAADFSRLGEAVESIEQAGADWVHYDVMDGHFVPNLTVGPAVLAAIKGRTSLPLDVHLMIEAPERSIEDYVRAGATTVGVHVETCPHLHNTVAQIRRAGARACVVLNPATSAETIRTVLPDVNQVLVMTVNPGFGGQSFIESMLPKITTIRRWIDEGEHAIDLEVDGGIDSETIERAAAAGANAFVAGTAVFGKPDTPNPDIPATIALLRERASQASNAAR